MHLNIPFTLVTVLVFAHYVSSSSKPSSLVKYFPRPSPEDVSKANELLKASATFIPGALDVQSLKGALLRGEHQLVAKVFKVHEKHTGKVETIATALEHPSCTAELFSNLDAVAKILPAEPRAVVLYRIMINIPWKGALERIEFSLPEAEEHTWKAVAHLVTKSIVYDKISLAKHFLDLKAVRKNRDVFGSIISRVARNLLGLSFEAARLAQLLKGIIHLDKEGYLTTEMLTSTKKLTKCAQKLSKSFVMQTGDFLKHPLIDKPFFENLVSFSIKEQSSVILKDLIYVASSYEFDALESTLPKEQRLELCQLVSSVGIVDNLERAWKAMDFLNYNRGDRHAAWFKRHATPIFRALEALNILPLVLNQVVSEYAASQRIGS